MGSSLKLYETLIVTGLKESNKQILLTPKFNTKQNGDACIGRNMDNRGNSGEDSEKRRAIGESLYYIGEYIYHHKQMLVDIQVLKAILVRSHMERNMLLENGRKETPVKKQQRERGLKMAA